MTQKIPASAVAGITNFAVAAATHAAEMKSWRAHMARVTDDQKNDVPIEQRHAAYPRPRAHPLVEHAVDENDEVNFEVVDDGPTPDERFAAKKMALIHAVSIAEQAAVARISSPGRRRLFDLRENDIVQADAKRRLDIRRADQQRFVAEMTTAAAAAEIGIAKAMAAKVGIVKLPAPPQVRPTMTDEEITAQIERERTAEDTAHLAAQRERARLIDEIVRKAAQAHHDIEDLTAETIGGWKLPTF